MTDHIWHDYSNPPDCDRVVILRFGTSGLHDCEGRYHAKIDSYVRRYAPAVSIWAVRPTAWREVFTRERC